MATPLIIDGNSLAMRCIMASAVAELQAGSAYTGGIYGSIRMLRSILAGLNQFRVGPVYAFWDRGEHPERLRLWPDYKIKRVQKKELIPEEEKEKI